MTSFAVITPSYAPDYQRSRLLCKTLDDRACSKFTHYLVVDAKDYRLFASLESDRRKILTVESILPWWIIKSPFKNGWFSLKSIPLRNWIVQQLVKLSMSAVVDEDILVYVDSDVTFVRQFDFNDFVNGDRVRLFRQSGVITSDSELGKWSKVASNLLEIEAVSFPAANYLGNFIIWRKDNLISLQCYLERLCGKSWLEVVANSWHLSEYQLYGVYCEYILGDLANHYYDDRIICHNYWHENQPMNETQIQDFFLSLPNSCFAVMISAKSGTKLEQIIPHAMLDYGTSASFLANSKASASSAANEDSEINLLPQ